jgi:hypothetical protein
MLVLAYTLFGAVVTLAIILAVRKSVRIFRRGKRSSEKPAGEKFAFDVSYLSYQLLLGSVSLFFLLVLLNATFSSRDIYSESTLMKLFFEIEKGFSNIGLFGWAIVILLCVSFVLQFYSRRLIGRLVKYGEISATEYNAINDRARIFSFKIGILFLAEILWLFVILYHAFN